MSKLIVFLLILPLPSLAKVQFTKSFRPYWAEATLGYERYLSIENLDDSGNRQPLPYSNSFWSTGTLDFEGRYVLSSNLALRGALVRRSVQANIGQTTRYAEGLESVSGALDYRLHHSSWDLGLEALSQLSLFSVPSKGTTPLLGDGAHVLGGFLWIQSNEGLWRIFARGGFLYRSEGLSALVPYELNLIAHWNALVLRGGLSGSWSILSDQDTDAFRTNYLQQVDAGSFDFRSANPTIHRWSLQAEWWATKQFQIFGGMSQPYSGVHSSFGSRLFLGANIQWQVFETPTPQDLPWRSSSHKLPAKGSGGRQ